MTAIKKAWLALVGHDLAYAHRIARRNGLDLRTARGWRGLVRLTCTHIEREAMGVAEREET